MHDRIWSEIYHFTKGNIPFYGYRYYSKEDYHKYLCTQILLLWRRYNIYAKVYNKL